MEIHEILEQYGVFLAVPVLLFVGYVIKRIGYVIRGEKYEPDDYFEYRPRKYESRRYRRSLMGMIENSTKFESEYERPAWSFEDNKENKRQDEWYCDKCGYRNKGFQSSCICGQSRPKV